MTRREWTPGADPHDDDRLTVGDEALLCGAMETDGRCVMAWPCAVHGRVAAA